jgi:hypothetical protein
MATFLNSWYMWVALTSLAVYAWLVFVVQAIVQHTDGVNKSKQVTRTMSAPIWWVQDAVLWVWDQTYGRIERRHENLERFKESFEGREPSATGQHYVRQRLRKLAEEFRYACEEQERARHARVLSSFVIDHDIEVRRAKDAFWTAHLAASRYPQFELKPKVEDYYQK